MKAQKLKFVFILFYISFLSFSCTSDIVYNNFQTIENTVWEKDKEYSFTFNIDDCAPPYDIILTIRNNNLYPYQNIWLLFYAKDTLNNFVIQRDTVEFILADESGKWHGTGISLFQNKFNIKEKYSFPYNGEYSLYFGQGMRNEKLKGIQDLGLKIVPATK